MEKQTMIKNVRAMMAYADKCMKGVVKEEVKFRLQEDAYHYTDFRFYPPTSCNGKGACIEFGSWDNTYTRLYANETERYGGWCGGPEVNSYETTSKFNLRDDMMRLAMLKWDAIKDAISKAVEKENKLDSFTLGIEEEDNNGGDKHHSLVIDPSTFDEDVWQDRNDFTEEQYNIWLKGAIGTLQEIYDSYDGEADVYVLGDIINMLSNTSIVVPKNKKLKE